MKSPAAARVDPRVTGSLSGDRLRCGIKIKIKIKIMIMIMIMSVQLNLGNTEFSRG